MELSMAAVVIYKHNILNLATTSMSPFEMQMFMIILGIITNKHLYFLKWKSGKTKCEKINYL